MKTKLMLSVLPFLVLSCTADFHDVPFEENDVYEEKPAETNTETVEDPDEETNEESENDQEENQDQAPEDPIDAPAPTPAPDPNSQQPCSYRGQRLWGNVFITNDPFASNAIKINEQPNDYPFLDLIVRFENYENAASGCGHWYEVDDQNDADFTIKYVSGAGDVRIGITGGVPRAGVTGNSNLPR